MIHNLFPIPLYMSRASDPASLAQELEQAQNRITWADSGELDDQHPITTVTYFDDVIASAQLDLFAAELEYHLAEYCRELDFTVIAHDRASWLAEYNRNDFSASHDHGTADIAGVYYYQTTGDDGNIYFERPGQEHTSLAFTDLGDRFEMRPVEGMILLFPGWLRHGVTKNTTDDTRKVISFNIWFDRTAWIKQQLGPSK